MAHMDLVAASVVAVEWLGNLALSNELETWDPSVTIRALLRG
jgi:hypothetical protein